MRWLGKTCLLAAGMFTALTALSVPVEARSFFQRNGNFRLHELSRVSGAATLYQPLPEQRVGGHVGLGS